MKLLKNKWYVYIKRKPNGQPFYIGKGRNKRVLKINGRNDHFMNIIKKYGIDNIKTDIIYVDSEPKAFILEELLIKFFKESGHILANKTSGGEGPSLSDEVIEKHRARMLGSHPSEETKRKISATLTGRKLGPRSLEIREKISKAHVGRKKKGAPWNKGKVYTKEETIKYFSDRIGKPRSLATRLKIADKLKGRTASEETRAKMSVSQTGKHLSEQHKLKIVESWKRRRTS